MDDIKDMQKTDQVSRFIDAHNVRTNPFGENKAGERAYRRAERIAAALHLVTNHIDGSEPVRQNIRTSATSLLEKVLAIRDEMRVPNSSSIHSLQACIRHLISLTKLASVSGFVSMQNAGTMIEALDELGNYLSVAQRTVLAESFSVSRDELMDIRTPVHKNGNIRHKDIKDSTYTDDTDTHTQRDMSDKTGASNGQRSESILEILRGGGPLGIKDIASNLPEYSEKMIQRELQSMAARGQIKKEGFKRWSRYSAADGVSA